MSLDLNTFPSLIPESYLQAGGVGVLPRPLWGLFAWDFVRTRRRSVIVVPDRKTLDEILTTLSSLLPGWRIVAIPGWDLHPYDSLLPHPRIVSRILSGLLQTKRRDYDLLIVEATLYLTPAPLVPSAEPLALIRGSPLEEKELLRRGYQRVVEVEEPGEFALRGSVLDLWSPLEEAPSRVDRFDIEIDQMRAFDPISQVSLRRIERYHLGVASFPIPEEGELLERIVEGYARLRRDQDQRPFQPERIAELLRSGEEFPGRLAWLLSLYPGITLPYPPDLILCPQEVEERLNAFAGATLTLRQKLREENLPYPLLPTPPALDHPNTFLLSTPEKPPYPTSPLPPLRLGNPTLALHHLYTEGTRQGYAVAIADRDPPLLRNEWNPGKVFAEPHLPFPPVLKGNWDLHPARIRILEATSFIPLHTTPPQSFRWRSFDLGDLKEGDLLVHKEYGIGRYMGLKRLAVGEEEVDTIELAYEGEDRLFIPITRLGLISPYIAGVGEAPPRLDRLRSSEFKERRARAKKDLLRFAGELLKLYADRSSAHRSPLNPPGELYLQVESGFPYEETSDQLKVMQEIEEDLQKDRPMDRLLVGDVGFGKTEIALRTAVRFIENGYQVALLAPTTILVTQHGLTFKERLGDLPVRLATLTRFTSPAEEKEILKELREGTLDLVIGTHRLLMPDVEFKRLGLVIVDEEHRFGVKQKEALKSLRKNVDSLSLSATPIPRTLEIHLSGIRDLSTLFVPPRGRLEVETRILPLTDELVRDAIERERRRGGQIFILYNLIEGLTEKLQWIQTLVPDLKIAVIHGKMPAREIRRVFEGFRDGTIEALLATTIIESGLDFPRANTLIILDAHEYGLADLYQLRGRVGRSEIRAFCYFCYPPSAKLTSQAQARLNAIKSFTHLGSGLQLALMDLEIRGAGEFLGKRQSGHIRTLGFFTTLQILEEAIAEVRGEERIEMVETDLEGDYPPSLTPEWIPEPRERLRIYHRFFSTLTPKEANSAIQEILDRYGAPPSSKDQEFLELIELRPLFPLIGARTARFSAKTLRLWISDRSPLDRTRLIEWAKANPAVHLHPEYLELRTEEERRMKGWQRLIMEMIACALPEKGSLPAKEWLKDIEYQTL